MPKVFDYWLDPSRRSRAAQHVYRSTQISFDTERWVEHEADRRRVGDEQQERPTWGSNAEASVTARANWELSGLRRLFSFAGGGQNGID